MSQSEKSHVNPLLGATVHLFQKLIGNDDYGLRVYEPPAGSYVSKIRPAYNVSLLKKSDGEILPVIADLDLSTLVYGVNHFKSEFKPIPDFRINVGCRHFLCIDFLECGSSSHVQTFYQL